LSKLQSDTESQIMTSGVRWERGTAYDVNGLITFTYTVTDGRLTTEGEVVVDFAAVNDAPIANDDTGFSVDEGTSIEIDYATLIANDLDVEGDAFNIISVFDGTNGSVASVGNKAVFTPNPDYFGNAGFKYIVEDTFGAQSTGEVFISVLPVVDITLGTTGDDTITGTSQADVISGGAGDDTIIAGAGDDTIIYTSGNDKIEDSGNGGAFDTLDLSQYAAADVSFRIVGHDTFIDTPDGVIELDYQVRNVLGSTKSNIEQIIFSDGTLDEAAIKARALGDQGTAGDDIVTGSIQADVISSGAGNDTIIAGGGDDTIIYTSGNDKIEDSGNGGAFDTLDLSQYAAADVSFRIVGHDVLIDTPDGVIELDYQVRNVLGSTKSNIEQIIFSDGTLDEAAIKARALGDQGTAGDDIVTGSIQADVISSGAGNDIIFAGGGDDTIIYTSGNDKIEDSGNGGAFDTLDLSQYAAADVSFRIENTYDVMIITPDGVIELDYQVRYDVGNVKSNIEQIIFSDGTLDEAGIKARAINQAPVFAPIDAVHVSEDQAFSVTLANDMVTDANADPLTLSLTRTGGIALPAWLSFDAVTRTLTGTPPADFNGVIELELRADDGALQTIAPLQFIVDPVNDIPLVSAPLSDRFTTEDQDINVVLQRELYSDIDGDALSFDLRQADGSVLPAWLAFDEIAFAITGRPPENFAGDIDLRLYISDGTQTVSDDFILTVTPVNDAPVLTNPLADMTTDSTGSTLATGQPFVITLPDNIFVDPDGDALGLAATLADGSALPGWLIFDGTTFSGTAPLSGAGIWQINLFASDGVLEASNSFSLTIDARNAGPEARDDGVFNMSVTKTLVLEGTLLLDNDTDFDGDTLTITAVSGSANGTVTLEGNDVVYTPFLSFDGIDQFSYTVSDGTDTDTATISVNVTNDYNGVDVIGNDRDRIFASALPVEVDANGNDILFGGNNASQVPGSTFTGGANDDFLSGGANDDTLFGDDGNDVLQGNDGNDQIYGGAGDDYLIGGQGQDTFYFGNGDGSDRVLDFQVSSSRNRSFIAGDQLAIGVDGIGSFEDLLAFASQETGGVLFDFGNGDELFLQGTQLAALDQNQFTFY
jgi:Ca2+-binding RTX toxin-like protein